MRFLKENSDIVVKLYINQIGIAIFSMFLYTIVGALQSENEGFSLLAKVLVSVFALLFYFVLVYLAVWEIGAKDKIRIDAQRMEKNSNKGFLIGLLANALNFIVWGIATLLMGIYLITPIEWIKTTFGIFNLIFRLFSSMYLGVVQGLSTVIPVASENIELMVESLGFLILPILSVLVTHLAYFMGVNNYRIIPSRKK